MSSVLCACRTWLLSTALWKTLDKETQDIPALLQFSTMDRYPHLQEAKQLLHLQGRFHEASFGGEPVWNFSSLCSASETSSAQAWWRRTCSVWPQQELDGGRLAPWVHAEPRTLLGQILCDRYLPAIQQENREVLEPCSIANLQVTFGEVLKVCEWRRQSQSGSWQSLLKHWRFEQKANWARGRWWNWPDSAQHHQCLTLSTKSNNSRAK